jgi:hypothetical protein
MADIELVIKIPEEKYNYVKNQVAEGITNPLKICIATGTPLPKGHGNLVDMSQLDSKMYHMAFETDTDLQKWDSGCWIRYKLYEDIRDAMPVIIGAESEG